MANERRGIQSIEVGGALLRALVDHGSPMTLRDLARKAGMTPAKAHPYLVSYSNLGLIQQDGMSGHYELGPFALQMGMIAMQRSDPVRIAAPLVEERLTQFGQTVALATAGSHGPTIVHIHPALDPIHVTMRTGTVMSLMQTATGQVFAAYLPPKTVEAMMAIEEAGALQIGTARQKFSRSEVEARLSEVREHGLARSIDDPIAGISALSAPVFNHAQHIVLAITVIGPSGSLDGSYQGPMANHLRDCAAAVSAALGFSTT